MHVEGALVQRVRTAATDRGAVIRDFVLQYPSVADMPGACFFITFVPDVYVSKKS